MTTAEKIQTMIAKLTDEKLIEAFQYGRTVSDRPGAETAQRFLQQELARRFPRGAWRDMVGA